MNLEKLRYLAVGLIVTICLAGCALPLVSEAELEIESDKEFNKMRTSFLISNDARTRSYVNCVARAIIEQLDEPYRSKDWEIEVFDEEAVNAFAMPGGKIGVFTGILTVAENQDQLGAVLGHEVAHVTERHSLERVNREMTTQGGLIAATAALGGGQTTADILQMGAQFGISLPYGRSQESEADIVGIDFMSRAGFDPRQSVQLWKNMDKNAKAGPPEFMSTHPSSDTRIADLVSAYSVALPIYNEAVSAGMRPECSL